MNTVVVRPHLAGLYGGPLDPGRDPVDGPALGVLETHLHPGCVGNARPAVLGCSMPQASEVRCAKVSGVGLAC